MKTWTKPVLIKDTMELSQYSIAVCTISSIRPPYVYYVKKSNGQTEQTVTYTFSEIEGMADNYPPIYELEYREVEEDIHPKNNRTIEGAFGALYNS